MVIHSSETRSINGLLGIAKLFLCFLHRTQLVTVLLKLMMPY